MIYPGGAVRIHIATEPVDFRKSLDSLAALVQHHYGMKPFSGDIFIFRNRGADKLKALFWDGTGMVLVTKYLEDGQFRWPNLRDGVYTVSRSQFEALIEGLDWKKIRPRDVKAPTLAA
jgi:transposase